MDCQAIRDKIIAEMSGQHLAELLQTHAEVSSLTASQEKRLDVLMNTLPNEYRQQIGEFADKENALYFIKQQHIYLAGALDCVKLLKELGVLS